MGLLGAAEEAITSFGNDACLSIRLNRVILKSKYLVIAMATMFIYLSIARYSAAPKSIGKAPAPGVDEQPWVSCHQYRPCSELCRAGTVEFIVEQRPSADGKSEMGYFMK